MLLCMCRKIRCNEKSEKICKTFWELNKAYINFYRGQWSLQFYKKTYK